MFNLIADGGSWSFTQFLNGLNASITTWAATGVIVLGLIMVVVALFKMFKGFISDKAQTNWVQVIATFLIGAALAFGGGWAFVHDAADFGTNTLNEISAGGPAT